MTSARQEPPPPTVGDRERMLREKLALDAQIAELKAALAEARRRAAATGVYQDRDWFRRTEARVKELGRRSQQIQLDIGAAKRARAAENARDTQYESCFVQVARRRLTPEFFDEILAEAKELADNAAREAEK